VTLTPADQQPNNPLHGVTLKAVLEDLVERHGWPELARRIRIRCFAQDPSIKSSLSFLRKTGWARMKVEQLYLADQQRIQRNRKRNRRRADQRAYRAQLESEQPNEGAETEPDEGRAEE
jgi:uncharacterized protein (DUF2132 family)